MDKREIKNSVLENLIKVRENLIKSREEYKEAAKDAPGAMQSHSDTSKFQFNILADNIASQLQKLDDAVILLREYGEKSTEAEIGAFLKIKENGEIRYFYLVPEGAGGFKVKMDSIDIQVLAVNSLVGKAFLFKKTGQEFELQLPAGKRLIKILEIN